MVLKLDKDSAICCPHCESNYTNFIDIKIYMRDEDAEICTETSVTGNRTHVATTRGFDNPSPRRSGIIVVTECESCENQFCVEIYQHKGRTYVELKA